MGIVDATLLLLLITTMTVPWARRTGMPVEILLVLGSLAFSLLPGLPRLILDPTVAFKLFLPPILFDAAFFTSWRDFKNSRCSIFLLAFGLVLFTTGLVAVAARALGLARRRVGSTKPKQEPQSHTPLFAPSTKDLMIVEFITR